MWRHESRRDWESSQKVFRSNQKNSSIKLLSRVPVSEEVFNSTPFSRWGTAEVLWHDDLNNTVTRGLRYPRSEIKADELAELLKLKLNLVSIVPTVYKGGTH